MYILEDVYTKERHSFSNTYQIGKYLYEKGIAKSIKIQTAIKRAIKNGTAIYKHYFIFEIPDNK